MTAFKVEPETATGRVGESYTVKVNAYNASNLFAWQVFIYWNATILGYADSVFGGFLAGQPNGTFQVKNVNHVNEGRLAVCEASLGRVSGVTGDGWLISVDFHVLALGETCVNISNQYTFWQDSLLNVVGDEAGEMVKENSFFHTLHSEDVNGDGIVDAIDVALVVANWCNLAPAISPPAADVNRSGLVEICDLSMVGSKYGEKIRLGR